MFIDVEGLPLKALYGVCVKDGKTMAWARLYGQRTSTAFDRPDKPGAGGLEADMGPDYGGRKARLLEVFIKVKGQNQVSRKRPLDRGLARLYGGHEMGTLMLRLRIMETNSLETRASSIGIVRARGPVGAYACLAACWCGCHL